MDVSQEACVANNRIFLFWHESVFGNVKSEYMSIGLSTRCLLVGQVADLVVSPAHARYWERRRKCTGSTQKACRIRDAIHVEKTRRPPLVRFGGANQTGDIQIVLLSIFFFALPRVNLLESFVSGQWVTDNIPQSNSIL